MNLNKLRVQLIQIQACDNIWVTLWFSSESLLREYESYMCRFGVTFILLESLKYTDLRKTHRVTRVTQIWTDFGLQRQPIRNWLTSTKVTIVIFLQLIGGNYILWIEDWIETLSSDWNSKYLFTAVTNNTFTACTGVRQNNWNTTIFSTLS